MYWTIMTPVKHFRSTFLLVQTAVTYRPLFAAASRHHTPQLVIQSDTKKRELLKNPTKIEEIQGKKLLAEIEPLQLAF